MGEGETHKREESRRLAERPPWEEDPKTFVWNRRGIWLGDRSQEAQGKGRFRRSPQSAATELERQPKEAREVPIQEVILG